MTPGQLRDVERFLDEAREKAKERPELGFVFQQEAARAIFALGQNSRALPVLNEGAIPNSYYMQAPEFTGHVPERRSKPRGQ